MKLSAGTSIHQLLKEFPFLEDFLVQYNPKFQLLRKRALRATIGRVASLKMVASMGEVQLERLLADLAAEIKRQSGQQVTIDEATADAGPTRKERVELLKQIIRDLHEGGDLETARQRFAVVVKDVQASEIAEMEQQLIREGMSVQEVQRLCDVHVGAFRQALDEHAAVQVPPGHPVHTYMQENERITELLDRLGELAQKMGEAREDQQTFTELGPLLEELGGIENHYVRKENQLFPLLEKHGIDGPPKVMWGVHDEIRATYKRVVEATEAADRDALLSHAPELIRSVAEMIYKEDKILFPMCLDTFDEAEWRTVRQGEDSLGYAFAKPAEGWFEAGEARAEASPADTGQLPLDTGRLSLEQINLIMTHLPVDITFVDENNEVRYYSGGERHFPRSPGVIGRKVQNCHPAKSVHIVNDIVSAFRGGEEDVAEFWITHQARFLHIRYFAVRDADGRYRGCLEVSQDITRIKQLEGESRLLQWEQRRG